jgi:hypothetical protein
MSVTIDLDLRAEDVLGKLDVVKAKLESLEDEFDFSFDGEFKAQLDDLADTLDGLGDDLVDDLDDVATRLEELEIDVGSPVGDGDSGGDTGSDSGDRYLANRPGATMSMREIMARVRSSEYGVGFEDIAKRYALHDAELNLDESINFEELQDNLDQLFGGSEWEFTLDRSTTEGMDDGKLYGDSKFGKTSLSSHFQRLQHSDVLSGNPFGDGSSLPDRTKMGRFGRAAERASKKLGTFRGVVRRSIPSMADWWQIIALALPALITFGVQAAGVAGAMLSVAGAGAAMIGLGLVGHGEDMAESWREAQEQVKTLKEELFETFQPSMQTFAPIQGAVFDMLPVKLGAVNDELEKLAGTSYQYVIFDALSGATEFAAEFISTARDLDGIVAQLSMRFGDIVGSAILEFFEGMVREAYRNQETLIQLGGVILWVLEIIYNFSKIFAQLVIVFSPVIGLVLWLSRVLSNRLAVSIISIITVVGLFILMLVKTVSMLAKLRIALVIMSITGSGAMASFAASALSALATVEGAIMSTIASLSTLQLMLAATGIGLLAIGGGILAYQAMKPKGPPSGGSGYSGYTGRGYQNTIINEGDTYTFNVDGSTDGPTTQKMMDVAKLDRTTDSTRSLSLNGGGEGH